MKKFRIYKESKNQIIEADRAECKRKGNELSVSFFIGKRVAIKFDSVVCFYEVPPEVVIPQVSEKTYLDED